MPLGYLAALLRHQAAAFNSLGAEHLLTRPAYFTSHCSAHLDMIHVASVFIMCKRGLPMRGSHVRSASKVLLAVDWSWTCRRVPFTVLQIVLADHSTHFRRFLGYSVHVLLGAVELRFFLCGAALAFFYHYFLPIYICLPFWSGFFLSDDIVF